MGQRVLTHDPSTFFSCDPMAAKDIACFASDRIKNTAIHWHYVR
jgi:hypothetical protein